MISFSQNYDNKISITCIKLKILINANLFSFIKVGTGRKGIGKEIPYSRQYESYTH